MLAWAASPGCGPAAGQLRWLTAALAGSRIARGAGRPNSAALAAMCAVKFVHYLFAAHLCVLVALVPAEQVLLHQQFLDHSRVECGQRLLESFGEPQLGVSHGGGRPHCGRRGKGGGERWRDVQR